MGGFLSISSIYGYFVSVILLISPDFYLILADFLAFLADLRAGSLENTEVFLLFSPSS